MHALPIIAIVLSTAAFMRTRRRYHVSDRSCATGGPTLHRCHGRRGRGMRWGRRGRRRWLYWLSTELDLSPAQEKAVHAELRGLRDNLGKMRDEGGHTRADLADVLAGEAFDPAVLDALFSRHDDQLSSARTEITAALKRTHELLDDAQRRKLADLLGGGRRFRGPYR